MATQTLTISDDSYSVEIKVSDSYFSTTNIPIEATETVSLTFNVEAVRTKLTKSQLPSTRDHYFRIRASVVNGVSAQSSTLETTKVSNMGTTALLKTKYQVWSKSASLSSRPNYKNTPLTLRITSVYIYFPKVSSTELAFSYTITPDEPITCTLSNVECNIIPKIGIGSSYSLSPLYKRNAVVAGKTKCRFNLQVAEALSSPIHSYRFIIGSNTTDQTNLFSVPVNTNGTNIKVLASVIDKRGNRSETYTFNSISEVFRYTTPYLFSPTFYRIDSSGSEKEEGTRLLLRTRIQYNYESAYLLEPIIKDSDDNVIPTTWYNDRAFQDPINWNSYEPDVSQYLYGVLDGTYRADQAFTFYVTAQDSIGAGGTKDFVILPAYYELDIRSEGVAFGQMAKDKGFHCNMDATFYKDLFVSGADAQVDGNIIATGNTQSEDMLLELDTTAQSGDDYDIYTALQTLSWDSDVIV